MLPILEKINISEKDKKLLLEHWNHALDSIMKENCDMYFDEGFQKGFDEGIREGKQEGYLEGYKDAYKEGFVDGIKFSRNS